MNSYDGPVCSRAECEQPITYRTDFEDYCSADCKLDAVIEDDILHASEHIYVLRLTGDGSTWYYVGASSNVRERLKVHMSNPPSTCWMKESLEVDAVEEVTAIETGEEPPGGKKLSSTVREREHERAMEIAIERDTTNVLGGK